ncbi:MAG: hypothetical protein ACJ761_04135 [Chloroflexota bacterium]
MHEDHGLAIIQARLEERRAAAAEARLARSLNARRHGSRTRRWRARFGRGLVRVGAAIAAEPLSAMVEDPGGRPRFRPAV